MLYDSVPHFELDSLVGCGIAVGDDMEPDYTFVLVRVVRSICTEHHDPEYYRKYQAYDTLFLIRQSVVFFQWLSLLVRDSLRCSA